MDYPDFSFARRENNSKRDFIIINKFQSKHYPSDPARTAAEFSALGRELKGTVGEERVCVIGFAETAVAVGAFIAKELGCYYVSTTREELPDCFEYITTEESHSHAALHRLRVNRDILCRSERIIIADDEFTTGSTAIKLAEKLREYSPECRFTAAAFIASDEAAENFRANGIECIAAKRFSDFDAKFPEKYLPDRVITPRKPDDEIYLNAVYDHRLGVDIEEYFAECESLSGKLAERLSLSGNIAVIGTEELCVPPVVFGKTLSNRGCRVTVHGVTRSPMLPSDEGAYAVRSRAALKSLYDPRRRVFIYNVGNADVSIIITDAEEPDESAVELLCGALSGRVILVRWRGRKMPTSLRSEDGRLLLTDITGKIAPLSAKEREPLIQSGVHYSELLPAEYEPSAEYIKQYERGLAAWSEKTAQAVSAVAERIYAEKPRAAIVSLARAGTPVGALIVRYLRRKYGVSLAHYSISIIRGKGIDRNAMRYILARHASEDIQFVDGWTGKGAITRQLREALKDYPEADARPAVLADPAGLCDICGTREDIFIPCACLNAVVSGLFSRTVLRDDIIFEGDFHGAAYFAELADRDRTYEFINAVESKMSYDTAEVPPPTEYGCGLKETEEIAEKFGVTDINLVKPGIGETTRVLLRRIPRIVLVREKGSSLTAHIEELAAEKGVEVREYPLKCYRACGIIQMLGEL
ncbi:MAG: phosphoribosyltransferase [Oscillospiraceae bacterium]|nr:phosphoribosyltransferase [Oscillospiraceae bacterium]